VEHTHESGDHFGAHKTILPQPPRLTPQQMDERRAKGLCFNCISKYSKGHKCGENKLFYIDYEEEEDHELEPPKYPDLEQTTPTISCHALANINTPQTLKIQGYIKKKKVTILIDSGSAHNFINYKLAKDLNCFVYLELEFQVMIADGGTINCLAKFHGINLNMGEYFLVSSVISIQMGSDDVVLGVQWLHSLGIVALNFQYIFMIFSSDRKEIELKGIQEKPSKVISSNIMTNLLKKGHQGVIAQVCSLDVQTSIFSSPPNLKIVINDHSKVFGEMPKGLPPTRDHDHAIHLWPGSVPPNIRLYGYPLHRRKRSSA
jgi:hypothetical protein